ncbi:MAG: Cof-type HAD-IIB family hydrolase [Anaerolineae bacterium]|nr:Cof-type HAD-IIB family hydrolase [Thermoflexales bacterium]MDW8394759.1 Cof-type HAD-IIB family hydrolase [Anaerolineae bacterium]
MSTPNATPAIRLLAVDLDGTTLDHEGQISPRVLAAVRAATERGVWVTIATGRNLPSSRPFAERLGINAPLICQQGGLVYDLTQGKVLRHVTLPHTLSCELLDLEREHPEWKAVLYHDSRIYITQADLLDDMQPLIGYAPTVVADLCAVLDAQDADKVLFTVQPEDAPRALHMLRERVGARATVVQSHARFVEVIPLEADKGSALRWLAQYLGVPREAVMAIGDQGNDDTMVAWAGVGVAMGNASPTTKALADWIAPPIDQDGAAIAIERFVLNVHAEAREWLGEQN